MKESSDSALAPIFANPASSGINPFPGLFMAVVKSKADTTKNQVVVYAALSDLNLFRQMILKVDPKAKIISAGNMNMITEDANTTIWNDKIIRVSFNAKEKKQSDDDKKLKQEITKAVADHISPAEMQKLLTPAAGNFYSSDPRFLKLMNEPGDIRMWSLPGFAPETKSAKNPALAMLNMKSMQEGTYKATTISFETGKIVFKTGTYSNRTTEELYKKYPPHGLNKDLLGRVPKGDILAMFAFSFSPAMLQEIFSQANLSSTLNKGLEKADLTVDDITGALKGDVVAGLVRAEDIDPEDSITQKFGGIQFFVATTIADKEKFSKLTEGLKKMKKKDSTETSKPNPFLESMKTAIQSDDHLWVMTTSPVATQKFISQSNPDNLPDWVSSHINGSGIIYIDLKTILSFVIAAKGGNDPDANSMASTFDKMIGYNNKFEEGFHGGSFEITMSDETENSLRQLIHFFESAYKISQKSKRPKLEGTEQEGLKDEENAKQPPPPPPASNSKSKNKSKG
ncbi:MAG: DUF4836 family protein [Bacteroidetes bacterium]|nr:DUF4836 family protein [Bacteroidota bacterium]